MMTWTCCCCGGGARARLDPQLLWLVFSVLAGLIAGLKDAGNRKHWLGL